MIDFYFTGPISLLSKYTVAGTKCSFPKVVAKSCENYDSFDLFNHRICMVCKAIINFCLRLRSLYCSISANFMG